MVDIWRNPIYTQTNQGKLVEPSWENNRGILTSHIINVDSRIREFEVYPNANHFKIKFPESYKNVYSIELLNACIPIVPNSPLLAADEKYVVMEIEEFDTTSGALTTGVSPNFTPLFDKAIAKIPLIEHFSGSGVTFWRKDELRAIKYFEPRKASLSGLEISLRQMTAGSAFGTTGLYPLADVALPIATIPTSENEVSYVFEIVSSN